MRLFLCGGGCGNQVIDAYQEFYKLIDIKKPLLYVPLAMNEDKYDSCYEWFSSEIQQMGLLEFEMVKSEKELAEKNFDNYCAIFIGGGNTYELLNKIKSADLFDKFIKYVKNNGIIFGGSAGAIILGKDIDLCKIDDGNTCNLKDTTGFNLVNNISFLCHLKDKNFIKNVVNLKKYSYKNKIIYLPEEDVIFINNSKVKTFGNKSYIVFIKGKYYLREFKKLKKEIFKTLVKNNHKKK